MDRDFYRQWKDHPVRSILGGAANGRLPTESDLNSLDVPDRTREQVRELCADLKERGDAGVRVRRMMSYRVRRIVSVHPGVSCPV